MPKLKSFFNSKGDALILEIKISTHELAHANLDVEAFEKIAKYDKDPSLVSQLKAILGMIGLLESLEKDDDDSWNWNPYQYINRNIRFTSSAIQPSFYGPNLYNTTQVKQQVAQNAANPLKCYRCSHINIIGNTNCTRCRATLSYSMP